MLKTLQVSCFLVISFSNLTPAEDVGEIEFLLDIKLWSAFIQDMAQYTGASYIYFITDTKSVSSNINQFQVSNNESIWFRYLSSNNSTLITESIMSDLKGVMLVILNCDRIIASSVLKKVMDDAYTLNKVSWIIDYSKSAKWFYKLNQKLEFSPSIRLFVISIDHVEGLKEKGIKVIINYAYSDYKKKTSRKNTMGYWQLKSGLSTIVPYSRCCYNMSGYRIKIVYAKGDLPYGNVEKTGNNLKITGIAGSILEEILNILDIRIVESEVVQTLGGLDLNMKPTGLFKSLSEKQADIAISLLGYTEDRNTVVDFTLSVMQDRIIGLYKPPDNSNSHFWSFYVKPFSLSSWILILTMILLLMMFSVILMRYFPQSGIGEVNQFDILVIWGLQLNQGSSHDHTSVGWRLYYLSVLILGGLLVSFYGSKIMADNVLKDKEFFNNFYEVANHPLYRPIVLKDGAVYRVLKSSTEFEASALWNRMKKDINNYTVTSEQVLEQVNCCHGVYIEISSYIKFLKSQYTSYVILDHSIGNIQMGIALQKNSHLTRMINTLLSYLQEAGITKYIINEYISSSNIKESTVWKPIVLSEINFPITIIGTAILFSIILCFIEIIWVKFRVANNPILS